MNNNYSSDSIDEILDSITEKEELKTKKTMLLAAKIDDARIEKGWTKTELMKAVGKNSHSEITKWLSGTYNFTIETLIELEYVLGINLLNV